jgi:DNA invertase Pin-like site-specific DNA recombinase
VACHCRDARGASIRQHRHGSDPRGGEATIESQLFELKRQIAAAGHELVKEYIDDGYSGAYLDRPALEEMREAVKTDAFDAVYFLCADRIARDAVHQNIIIGELLQHKKRIVIGGKDYEENPENRFALTVLGAVAEFERAKITERTMRGRMHRLRAGILAGGAATIYGYTYLRRTPTSAPALVINEEQAAIVRFIFETYASGNYSTAAIGRMLEGRGVPTYRGGRFSEHGRIINMLKNPTYTGIRYFNRTMVVHDAPGTGELPGASKRKRMEYRDPSEWIAIKVPAIISQQLFDQVQERLHVAASRYRKVSIQALLSGFLRCADCGRSFAHGYANERYRLRTGGTGTRERGQYRCSKRVDDHRHHVTNRGRCRNTGIATTMLDHTVVDLIRDTMLDPAKLARCIEGAGSDTTTATQLRHITKAIDALNDKRRRIYDAYAKEELSAAEYIEASREIDEDIVKLRRKKDAVQAASRQAGQANSITPSIHHYCATVRARFEACADFDDKRAFLRGYVERIVFDRGRITILGSLPLEGAAPRTLPFRIEGEIAKGSKRRWAQDERFGSWVPTAASTTCI